MSELNENTISLLKTTTGVDMSEATGDDARQILYTVPPGKTAIITNVCVRNPSTSLAGCSVVKFGNNSTAYDNWKSDVTLVTLTTVSTDNIMLPITRAKTTSCAAGTEFSIFIGTGATDAAATATIDVFGYLF